MEKLRVFMKLGGDLNRLVSDIIAAKADGVFDDKEEARIWKDIEQLVADAKSTAQRAK